MPADVQKGFGEFEYPDKISFLGYDPGRGADLSQLDDAVSLLEHAERPVIFAGGGVIRSGAAGKLTELAEKLEIPVVTSLLGKELSRNHIPWGFRWGWRGCMAILLQTGRL